MAESSLNVSPYTSIFIVGPSWLCQMEHKPTLCGDSATSHTVVCSTSYLREVTSSPRSKLWVHTTSLDSVG